MPNSSGALKFTTIFRANGLSPLHMTQIVVFTFAAAGLGLAAHLAVSPAQALVSGAAKLCWAGGLGATALSGPFIAWWYGRHLAARIELSHDGRQLRVRDANLLGARWRQLPCSQLNVHSLVPGDIAGEESMASPRLNVVVSGGANFAIPLYRRRDATGPLLRALRG